MTQRETTTVAVVGAGLMGCGIASTFAAAGFEVLLHDSAPDFKHRAERSCADIFAERVAAGQWTQTQADTALARIRMVDMVADLAGAAFVVEAIFEALDAKRALYTRLEACLPESAVIASSTSSFTPAQLSCELAHPERFLVAHFWNPPHLIPLVEVLAGEATTTSVVQSTMHHLRRVGCEAVLLHKAIPGFIGNRLQFAVLREALHLLREGVADAATIDQVMKTSLGRRYRWIGPLEGADLGGLNTFLSIAAHLMPQLAKDEDVLGLLRRHTEQGRMGRASGQGFYEWDADRQGWLQDVRQRMLEDGRT